jgi:predicted nucleic acid-binding protein
MILTPNNEYAALLDACVLVPMPLCDTLLRLAVEPSLYRPLWSNPILNEVGTAIERMGYTPEQSQRRVRTMREHFPEACVNIPPDLAQALTCIPDEDDRHVLAAAICGHANAIVTFNEKHFPEECLERYGVLRRHPDDFLIDQFHLCPGLMIEKIDSQAVAIHQPRTDIVSRLRDLAQAPKFAALLAERI